MTALERFGSRYLSLKHELLELRDVCNAVGLSLLTLQHTASVAPTNDLCVRI